MTGSRHTNRPQRMRDVALLLCCLLVTAGAALEPGSSGQWFWNSTTEAEANETTSTTTTTTTTTETPEISGRSSSSLAELFSDDFAPANVSRGRSSKALDLDLGVREGRILNADPGNRRPLALHGFIPIVAFSPEQKQDGEGGSLDQEETYQDRRQKALPAYGQRVQQTDKKPDYYIPPPQQYNKDPAVRYVSASEYHQRPSYEEDPPKNKNAAVEAYLQSLQEQYLSTPPQKFHGQDPLSTYINKNNQDSPSSSYPQHPNSFHQDPVKSEPSQAEGHFVVSSSSSSDDDAYRPQEQDTSAKQFGGHYEDEAGNYILSNPLEEEKCICVPFYLCKNGYLTSARALDKEDDIDERSARKIAKRSANESLSRDEKDEEATLAPYTQDIMARMIGLQNVGDSCGLLRRCCKVPPRRNTPPYQQHPGGLLPFSPDNYPLPPPFAPQRPPYEFPVATQEHHPGGPHQQIVLVQQQEPPRPPPQRRPRPVFPPPRPNPNRSIRPPAYQPPHPSYQAPPQHQEPVYQPQPSYPSPQPAYPPPGLRPHQPQCGARNGLGVHGRVNNLQYTDDASEFGEYPWQAAILLKVGPGNNLFVCGGTLLSSQWVATAAHCLKKHQAEELKVRLGDWDVHRDDEFYPYVEASVVEAAVHPDFYPGNLHNDLALLRLERPLDLAAHPHISPACLPDQGEQFDHRRCWVTGWGKNAFGQQGEYQSVLKEVDVPVLGHGECQRRMRSTRLGRSYALHPGFVCAGGEPGKDACTGDGGSPLVCEGGGGWKVAGLVSWGIGCGQPGVPGVYVNVAHYRAWIDAILHGRHRG